MSSLELTSFITALANLIACSVPDDDVLALLGSMANQLGDTLGTISAHRSLCNNVDENNRTNSKLE